MRFEAGQSIHERHGQSLRLSFVHHRREDERLQPGMRKLNNLAQVFEHNNG